MCAFVPGTSVEAADLSICAQEPIHIPGSIEPHGVLLVTDAPDLKIIQVSNTVRLILAKNLLHFFTRN